MSEKLLEQVLKEIRDFKVEVRNELSEVRNELSEIKNRVGNLEVETKGIREEHGTLLRTLEERTSVTNATVTRLAEDMDHIKGDVSRIVKRIDDHEIEIKVIKKAVAG
ncbi:MAG: hypothetical protein ACOY9Y_02190 [Bacillota bacterium]